MGRGTAIWRDAAKACRPPRPALTRGTAGIAVAWNCCTLPCACGRRLLRHAWACPWAARNGQKAPDACARNAYTRHCVTPAMGGAVRVGANAGRGHGVPGMSVERPPAAGARAQLPADASLDSIEMIEDVLSSTPKFDTRGALLESLRRKTSGESLDRILSCLARSGKIEISGESVQWIAANPNATAEKAEIVESCLETLDILADPDFARQLEESRGDYRAGRVVPWMEDSAQNAR